MKQQKKWNNNNNDNHKKRKLLLQWGLFFSLWFAPHHFQCYFYWIYPTTANGADNDKDSLHVDALLAGWLAPTCIYIYLLYIFMLFVRSFDVDSGNHHHTRVLNHHNLLYIQYISLHMWRTFRMQQHPQPTIAMYHRVKKSPSYSVICAKLYIMMFIFILCSAIWCSLDYIPYRIHKPFYSSSIFDLYAAIWQNVYMKWYLDARLACTSTTDTTISAWVQMCIDS